MRRHLTAVTVEAWVLGSSPDHARRLLRKCVEGALNEVERVDAYTPPIIRSRVVSGPLTDFVSTWGARLRTVRAAASAAAQALLTTLSAVGRYERTLGGDDEVE